MLGFQGPLDILEQARGEALGFWRLVLLAKGLVLRQKRKGTALSRPFEPLQPCGRQVDTDAQCLAWHFGLSTNCTSNVGSPAFSLIFSFNFCFRSSFLSPTPAIPLNR